MNLRNKLFVLPTDACNLSCSFCTFSHRREDLQRNDGSIGPVIKRLDLSRGHARESMKTLQEQTPIIGFSGGGEPLMHIKCILEIIRLSYRKRFIFTTNASFPPNVLNQWITEIDEACNETRSTAIIRMSVDRFHDANNKFDNLSTLIDWFRDPKWKRVRNVFFRSTCTDEEYVRERLQSVAKQLAIAMSWEPINPMTWNVNFGNNQFRVIFRPVIEPKKHGYEVIYSIDEYSDLMAEIEGGMTPTLGKPKGCFDCHGCRLAVDCSTCGVETEEGLDITVDTNGDVTLYGADLGPLGNIYDEIVSYSLIRQRITDDAAYSAIRGRPMKDLVRHLSEVESFKRRIAEINYPYNIIRELNILDSNRLRDKLIELSMQRVNG